MLDSFLKFLGLETKEKNPAPKNWTWQKPKEKESTRIFLKIKNAIYKQTEEIIMDYHLNGQQARIHNIEIILQVLLKNG